MTSGAVSRSLSSFRLRVKSQASGAPGLDVPGLFLFTPRPMNLGNGYARLSRKRKLARLDKLIDAFRKLQAPGTPGMRRTLIELLAERRKVAKPDKKP